MALANFGDRHHNLAILRSQSPPISYNFEVMAPVTEVWEIAELFKIEKGKIRRIEAVLEQAPYGSTSGWSKWEDAISSSPRW
jgi:hypothetical protein